jgi:two-component system, LuxR family, sensor kinase FixL
MARVAEMGGERSGALRGALVAILFFAGYLFLDWVSYIHPMQQYSITPWNPQPALAIALLMLGGQRWMPLVFAAVVGAEWLVRGAPAPWPSTLLIAMVLTLGYAAIARALTGRFSVRPALDSQRDAVRLAVVVSIGAFAVGVLYISALLAADVGPLDQPFTALVRFWIGDAVGILVTLPLLLMLSVRARRQQMADMLHSRETAFHAAVTVAAMALVFLLRADDLVRFFYVLFLPLIVLAARLGLAGAIFGMLAMQCAVIVSGELAHLQALTFFELQALLIALTVTGLFLGVSVDERKRAEAELRRTLRMAAAGEMAAALAHELNQPLTAVATYARAAQVIATEGAGDRALLVQTLDKLAVEAGRAAEVVRRLRDFFRSGTTHRAPASLEAIAARVVHRLRDAHEGLALELHAATGDGRVLADETQIEVVFRNLLANAIEASRSNARPRVSVTITPGTAETAVSVSDNGTGVPAADLERIFEPFETSRATGMGMGLAISRAIVEAHGGSLWAEPPPGGHFRFTLPAQDRDHE